MVHDYKGRELKVGDVVLVPAYIKEIHATESYCNANLQTVYDMPPDGGKNTLVLNTKQVLKAKCSEDRRDFAEAD